MDALVAVIITCYNEGPYIGAAVRSVLDQTRADLVAEIIIADDGSDAPTLAILRDIATWDSRIRVLYGPGGTGLPGQRCKAIAETTAPFLAILDGDDIWTPAKLEIQVPIMVRQPGIGLVYGVFSTFPDLNLAAAQIAPTRDISSASDLARAYFLNDPPIIPSTILMRRTAYDASHGFDPAVRVFEDTDFFLRLARVTRFAYVDTPLLYKRNRPKSITGARKDLMAWHAFVAFKAAADNPALLPYVPRRLAERARKLGNQRFLLSDIAQARALSSLACRLRPFSAANWFGWMLPRLPKALAGLLLKTALKSRVEALAATDGP